MKRVLVVALMLCLAAFALGCTSEGPTIPDDVENPHEADQQEQTPAMMDINTISLEEFAIAQNDMFASMNTDDMAMLVSAEGTVLVYTYQFFNMEIYNERGQEYFEDAVEEGQLLFETAVIKVPEITAIILEFVDAQGNVLDSAEFS
ncbi:MAG: hypothetical protein FWE48_05730 [Coriobacteriia bacterium]|nr:hypothetical protein [Coriobacteriia bacterium]MCL2746566.1 hypothetical protein [Coriobacteriia bacterium]MCL2870208.1 hypothetical protein [Coriobacteriia bacterium]